MRGCYDSDVADEPLCGLFTRTAAGPDAQSVAIVTDRYVNISRQRNRGGGRLCPDVSVPATFTHSLSLSRDVAERLRITLGVANLFDTPPPQVSTVVTATPPVIGKAPAFGTQYDYLGRRFFLSVRGKI